MNMLMVTHVTIPFDENFVFSQNQATYSRIWKILVICVAFSKSYYLHLDECS